MNYKKAYTLLCNKHIRFYFTNPQRTKFRDHIAEKQFRAVQKIIFEQTPENVALLKNIIFPKIDRGDYYDVYIDKNIEKSTCSKESGEYTCSLLYKVNRSIAIELGYIAGPQSEIEWHCNW